MFSPVDDIGQARITVRCVVTTKIVNEETATKGRLYARGFQEQQDFRTDSPTCSRVYPPHILVASHQCIV